MPVSADHGAGGARRAIAKIAMRDERGEDDRDHPERARSMIRSMIETEHLSLLVLGPAG